MDTSKGSSKYKTYLNQLSSDWDKHPGEEGEDGEVELCDFCERPIKDGQPAIPLERNLNSALNKLVDAYEEETEDYFGRGEEEYVHTKCFVNNITRALSKVSTTYYKHMSEVLQAIPFDIRIAIIEQMKKKGSWL